MKNWIQAHVRITPLAIVVLLGCASKPLPATPGVNVKQGTTETTGQLQIAPSVCSKIDLAADDTHRDENTLIEFLHAQNVEATLVRDRVDLVFADVRAGGPPVRLRVAILNSVAAAGEELHAGIIQHGTGAWGIHRSNLAVLAPAGSTDDILAFAIRTKLACWGVLTVNDGGEAIVIPGGYREL